MEQVSSDCGAKVSRPLTGSTFIWGTNDLIFLTLPQIDGRSMWQVPLGKLEEIVRTSVKCNETVETN